MIVDAAQLERQLPHGIGSFRPVMLLAISAFLLLLFRIVKGIIKGLEIYCGGRGAIYFSPSWGLVLLFIFCPHYHHRSVFVQCGQVLRAFHGKDFTLAMYSNLLLDANIIEALKKSIIVFNQCRAKFSCVLGFPGLRMPCIVARSSFKMSTLRS